MKKYWETQNGDLIEYKKLTDSHLLNILKFIERRAKEGVLITVNMGYDGDDDFITCEEYEIEGDEVKERYDYKNLLKEAKRRKTLVLKRSLMKLN